MASVDDLEELIATRKLNGLNDNLYKESDKPVANDKDYTLAYLKGYADAEEKYRQKIKDKIEEYDKKMTEDKGNPNWVVTDRIVMNVLKELLEENK